MRVGLRHNLEQKCGRAFRVEAVYMGFGQLLGRPGERLYVKLAKCFHRKRLR
jgi:hypothetical protein